MGLRIVLTGRVAVEADGTPVPEGGLGRLGRVAFAYLVAERHRPVPRDEVAEVLWGDALPRTWEVALRGVVSRVRALIGAAGLVPGEALTTTLGCYQLHLPAGTAVDVEDAAAAVAQAATELAAGRPGQARPAAEAAAAVAARRFLPEGAGAWVERRQAEVAELRLQALELVAGASAAEGDWAASAAAAEEALALQPYRESAHLLVVAAHAGAGNRAEALRAYERCRRLLAEELGVSPSPQTEAAHRALLGDEPVPAPPARAGPAPLPAALTPLVGREDDLANVRKLLETTRLLTLTGTGGVGKSRLALQAAAEVAARFADGAALVELAPLADPDLLAHRVLDAVGLHEEPGRPPAETLAAALAGRHMLLVLDNCEHLVSGCATLAEALLRACPRLRVLATSREPLGVPGETAWRVPSLGVVAAMALFADRAAAARPGLAIGEGSRPALAHLCARLDGIPLAIELAAARASTLSVEEIAERLDDRFRLLSGGARTAAPRQQTLRATVDWTYDALSDAERRFFNRLAVFGSAFTLAAAEDVAGGDGIDPADGLDLLAGLVNRSLVVAEAGDGPTRYRLLETMRHYARERLAESGEAGEVRARHLRWATALAEAAEPGLEGPEQGAWLDLLEAGHDDLRVALGWATSGTEAASGLRLAAALGRFWEVRGHLSEGRGWLDAALTLAGGDLFLLRAKALNWGAVLAQHQGDYQAARAHYEESLALRRDGGDRLGAAASLHGLGNVAALQGRLDEATLLFDDSLAIGRELGEDRLVAGSLANLGWVASARGDAGTARACYEEALARRRGLGDERGIAMLVNGLGDLALGHGDHATARRLHAESLELRRRLGDRVGVADSLGALGHLALLEGDGAEARARFEEALALRRALGDRPGLPGSLCRLADLARLEGDGATAAALVDEAVAVATELGDRHCITTSLLHSARLALDAGDPGRAGRLYRDALRPEDARADGATAEWLEGLGEVAAAAGDHRRAVVLLAAGDALRPVAGAPRLPAEDAAFGRRLDELRAAMGDAAFEAARAEGLSAPVGHVAGDAGRAAP